MDCLKGCFLGTILGMVAGAVLVVAKQDMVQDILRKGQKEVKRFKRKCKLC